MKTKRDSYRTAPRSHGFASFAAGATGKEKSPGHIREAEVPAYNFEHFRAMMISYLAIRCGCSLAALLYLLVTIIAARRITSVVLT